MTLPSASAPPLVVALHGGGVDARLWELVAQRLPLELFAPDLLPVAVQAEARADRLIELVGAMLPAGREFVVVGCSMGGVLGCGLAARLGARARGLLLSSAGPVVVDDQFLARISGLRELLCGEVTPELIEANLPMMVSAYGPFAAEAIPRVRRMIQANLGPVSRTLMDVAFDMRSPHLYLADVTCPVRAQFGAVDTFMATGWVDGWRERLGRENVTVFPGTSHQLPLERPDAVAAAIIELSAPRSTASATG